MYANLQAKKCTVIYIWSKTVKLYRKTANLQEEQGENVLYTLFILCLFILTRKKFHVFFFYSVHYISDLNTMTEKQKN